MFNDLISIVLPIYNEEKVIEETINDIKTACRDSRINFEIIAVNDCSKDRSSEILQNIDGIKVISHKINQGYGASIKTGIKNAQGSWILITDADGTYPNKDIPKLVSHLPDYDMVIGARTGSKVKIPLVRRPAKWFLNKFAGYLAGHKIPDLNSGLRVFKKDIAEKYWNLFPNRFSFTSTITMVCFTNGYSVKYLPINYFRREGKSSIRPTHFIDFLNLVIKLSLFFKPIKVFALLSLFLFLLGLGVGFYSKLVLGQLADVITVLLMITALQTFFFGLIAELIIRKK